MRRLIIPILIIFLSPVSVYQAEAIRTCTRVIDGDTIVLDGGERVRLIGVDTPETVHPTKPVQKFGVEASDFTKWLVEGKRVTLEYDQDRKDKYGRTLAYVYLENGTMVNAEIIRRGYGFAYTKYPFKYMEEFRQYERDARETGRGLWAKETKKQNKVAPNVTVATVIASGYNTIDYGFVEGGGAPASNEYYVSHFRDDGSVIYTDRWIAGTSPGSFTGAESDKESAYNETTSPEPETTVTEDSEETTDEGMVSKRGTGRYIGNSSSKIFHRPNCPSVKTMNESNKVFFNSQEEAINSGYRPCKRCNP